VDKLYIDIDHVSKMTQLGPCGQRVLRTVERAMLSTWYSYLLATCVGNIHVPKLHVDHKFPKERPKIITTSPSV